MDGSSVLLSDPEAVSGSKWAVASAAFTSIRAACGGAVNLSPRTVLSFTMASISEAGLKPLGGL